VSLPELRRADSPRNPVALLFIAQLPLEKVELKFLLPVHKSFSAILARYYVCGEQQLKALPKKRKHQMTRILSFNISKVAMLKYCQALWYASLITVYIWFLYWVSYDFFVWHKPLAEVNAVNYVGAIVSIALIWVGTKLWTRNRIKAGSQVKQQQELIPQKPQRQKLPQTTTQQTAPNNSTCTHYFGYLHQRQASQEIPAECLTCEKVLQCFSSTK
jgi:hypothetical protein